MKRITLVSPATPPSATLVANSCHPRLTALPNSSISHLSQAPDFVAEHTKIPTSAISLVHHLHEEKILAKSDNQSKPVRCAKDSSAILTRVSADTLVRSPPVKIIQQIPTSHGPQNRRFWLHFEGFWAVTPIWFHSGYKRTRLAYRSLEDVSYSFSRLSVKRQGHTGRNINDLDPIWARSLGRSQL